MLFESILSTLLRVVLPSVTILLLKYNFKILFTPLHAGTRRGVKKKSGHGCNIKVVYMGQYLRFKKEILRKSILNTIFIPESRFIQVNFREGTTLSLRNLHKDLL